jgi:N-acetylmuramoyl-L-alanine amidase
VVRFRVWLTTLFALSAVVSVFVSQAQQTDEGKPILKARAVESSSEKSPTRTPKSKASPHKKKKGTSATPSPKKKPKAKKSGDESSAKESETSATANPSPEPTTHPKPKKSPAKEPSPKGKKKAKTTKSPTPKKKSLAKPSETPEARPTATPPRAIAVPSPNAPPSPGPRSTSSDRAPVEEPEQLTIEKYGYEKPKGFWARLFGGGGRSSSGSGAGYRYLTSSVRAQIDRAPVARGRWQYIVVHNSGTRQGNAAAFDYYHRHFRRMQNGLAYHFVIGNGTSTGNGQIEVGDRWRRQINGGHVHSDYLNNIALGICLVGDFNRDQPTRAQLDCCEELIRYLRQRCGKVGDHYPIVKPHREINPPRWPTDCPGDVFPYSWFRRFLE